MRTKRRTFQGVAIAAGLFGAVLLTLPTASAHCDTLDGPVVADARKAFAGGDVTPVLRWVQKEDEGAIRAAFAQSAAIRDKGPEAKALAETYFFETLVRVHRQGEGAPFTGLKPAGGELDPTVAAADKALDAGSVDDLVGALTKRVASGTRERFARVVEAKKHAEESVPAGRAYVAAYVEFVHYAERLSEDAGASGEHLHAGHAE